MDLVDETTIISINVPPRPNGKAKPANLAYLEYHDAIATKKSEEVHVVDPSSVRFRNRGDPYPQRRDRSHTTMRHPGKRLPSGSGRIYQHNRPRCPSLNQFTQSEEACLPGRWMMGAKWESKCSRCGLCCHEKVVSGNTLVIDLDSRCEFYDPKEQAMHRLCGALRRKQALFEDDGMAGDVRLVYS